MGFVDHKVEYNHTYILKLMWFVTIKTKPGNLSNGHQVKEHAVDNKSQGKVYKSSAFVRV